MNATKRRVEHLGRATYTPGQRIGIGDVIYNVFSPLVLLSKEEVSFDEFTEALRLFEVHDTPYRYSYPGAIIPGERYTPGSEELRVAIELHERRIFRDVEQIDSPSRYKQVKLENERIEYRIAALRAMASAPPMFSTVGIEYITQTLKQLVKGVEAANGERFAAAYAARTLKQLGFIAYDNGDHVEYVLDGVHDEFLNSRVRFEAIIKTDYSLQAVRVH